MKNMDRIIRSFTEWMFVAIHNIIFGFFVALFFCITDLIISGAAAGNDKFILYWFIGIAGMYIAQIIDCWNTQRKWRKILKERKEFEG